MAECKVAEQCPLRDRAQIYGGIDTSCFWICGVRPDPAAPQLSEGRLVDDVEYDDVLYEYDPFEKGRD